MSVTRWLGLSLRISASGLEKQAPLSFVPPPVSARRPSNRTVICVRLFTFAWTHPIIRTNAMAKGQTRKPKEKKKPKSDKDKPKQLSAYQASKGLGQATAAPFGKKN